MALQLDEHRRLTDEQWEAIRAPIRGAGLIANRDDEWVRYEVEIILEAYSPGGSSYHSADRHRDEQKAHEAVEAACYNRIGALNSANADYEIGHRNLTEVLEELGDWHETLARECRVATNSNPAREGLIAALCDFWKRGGGR